MRDTAHDKIQIPNNVAVSLKFFTPYNEQAGQPEKSINPIATQHYAAHKESRDTGS